MKPVYSPCKDPLPYMFGGQNKVLVPGGTVFTEEGEARHVVKKFERFGVCFLTLKKGTKTKLDTDGVKEADETWKVKNRAWAEEVVLDFKESNRAKLDAGIKVDKPANVVKAAKFLGVALALMLSVLCAAPAQAQATTSAHANFAYLLDAEGGTATYCRLEGQNSDPYGQLLDGRGQVETSGSSVTITGVNAADDAFIDVSVGDLFAVRDSQGRSSTRVVVTNADDDTITVDTAIDLSNGSVWQWKRLVCGTAVTDGWIDVESWLYVHLGVQYVAGDITTLSVTWECKGGAIGAAPQRVYPGISADCGDGVLNGTVCEFTTVGDALTYKLDTNAFSACRIGVFTAGDGGTRDEVTITLDASR